MGMVRVGLSGWDYDPWSGDFYPPELPRDRRLAYVAERTDAVEVNGSFYALLRPDTYRSWSHRTPRGFRIALKGSRFITHNKKLSDARIPLANFLASGPLALEEKLGPLLWQLPERHHFDAERLAAFVGLLPKDTDQAVDLAREHDDRVDDVFLAPGANHRIRHVLEARHESFFCAEAVRILRDAGVALAISHAGGWPLCEDLTAGFAYVRLHGAPKTYESGYGESALTRWRDRILRWRDGDEPDDPARITERVPPRRRSRDVYVFFDNDAAGRAPHDALRLRELCSEDAGRHG